jgi:hypothetical protein
MHSWRGFLYVFIFIGIFGVPLETFSEEINYNSGGLNYSSPIAVSSDERLVWFVDTDSNSVKVMRVDTRDIIKTISVGNAPINISLSRDYAYVSNSGDGSISFIKIKNFEVQRFSADLDKYVGINGHVITGAEPRGVVVSKNGLLVFVANSSQDTISIIDAKTGRIVENYSIGKSLCNAPNMERHFQPSALALTEDGRYLFVTRFLSFTSTGGVQASDLGKEGIVCRLTVKSERFDSDDRVLSDPVPIKMSPWPTGFNSQKGEEKYAFPNQLQSIVVRDNVAYLPNVAASPEGPINYETTTQAFVNMVADVNNFPKDKGALNIHLGGRVPELGKHELYFSNPNSIVFTTPRGDGFAYVASGGSDVLVKLKVSQLGGLSFTKDDKTTRYIDLNDPDMHSTSDFNAGKNPVGLAISTKAKVVFVLNYVSRNISVVNIDNDSVEQVIRFSKLPLPGSKEELRLVGAELFYSSRGNFVNPSGLGNSRNRLSEKGRQSCASCHPRGLSDGVVWQFNTGPRKTISISGTFNPKDATDQRIMNASAIFDEVEDAEFNTRLTSSPGLLNKPQACIETIGYPKITESRIDPDHGLVLGNYHDFLKAPCVMNQFGVPNGSRPQATVLLPGSNIEIRSLDALKEWQQNGVRVPRGPMTDMEILSRGGDSSGGVSSRDIAKGRILFRDMGCSGCHGGGKWSFSSKDFISPPIPDDIATESKLSGANQFSFLFKYLRDIKSFDLNVLNSGNLIDGFPLIGGAEIDSEGLKALGYDHDNDGRGAGYTISSLLGIYNIQPYYHNGACETLRCVLSDVEHRNAGGSAGKDNIWNDDSMRLLSSFIESIDSETDVFD